MTRLIGSDLTPDLLHRFSPQGLTKHAHNVVLAITVAEDGYSNVAMLSHFEIIARDAKNLRLAMYSDSHTTANMRRTAQLTLAVIDEGLTYYLTGRIEELTPHMTITPHNALLNFHIESIKTDNANTEREGAATITSGISYDDPNMTAKVANAGATFAEMLG